MMDNVAGLGEAPARTPLNGDVPAATKMRLPLCVLQCATALFCTLAFHAAPAATGGEPTMVEPVDVSPCLAAIASDEVEKTAASCDEVIANKKTPKADRIKVQIARAGFYARHDKTDRAIADYDSVLQLDPSLADIFNARGELWRQKGDRPKALRDFAAALKLNPDHDTAKANHKAMAREIERIGAEMAVAGKPSFNCARARRAVEKAICASPELADLDREIFSANARVIRETRIPAEVRARRREQEDFIARRNAAFGRTGYDLKKAMQERLQKLNGVDGY